MLGQDARQHIAASGRDRAVQVVPGRQFGPPRSGWRRPGSREPPRACGCDRTRCRAARVGRRHRGHDDAAPADLGDHRAAVEVQPGDHGRDISRPGSGDVTDMTGRCRLRGQVVAVILSSLGGGGGLADPGRIDQAGHRLPCRRLPRSQDGRVQGTGHGHQQVPAPAPGARAGPGPPRSAAAAPAQQGPRRSGPPVPPPAAGPQPGERGSRARPGHRRQRTATGCGSTPIPWRADLWAAPGPQRRQAGDHAGFRASALSSSSRGTCSSRNSGRDGLRAAAPGRTALITPAGPVPL